MYGANSDGPRRILLAEDNPADILMFREGLRAAGVSDELVVVEDGANALDALYSRGKHAGTRRPEIVVLDPALPGIDGREVLRAIKADPDLHNIPVFMLAAPSSDDDVTRMYDLHCNCVIRKPLDLEGYIAMVRDIATFWLKLVSLPNRPD